ncbi:hypothetical protein CS8_053970 [Cupriavidus sp. 8B]
MAALSKELAAVQAGARDTAVAAPRSGRGCRPGAEAEATATHTKLKPGPAGEGAAEFDRRATG